MGILPFSELQPIVITTFLVPASATTPQSFNSATYNQFRLDAIVASSTDSVDRKLALYIFDGLFSMLLGVVNVPAGAGNGTIPVVDVIAGLPAGIQGFIVQAVSTYLQVGVLSTITAAKQINVVGVGAAI